MEDEEYASETRPVPNLFHSVETEKPFSDCVQCGINFRESFTPYLIKKHYAGEETVFEMAVCFECMNEIHEEFSEASREKIAEFTSSRVDYETRTRLIQKHEPDELGPWIGTCMMCNAASDDTKNFSHAAYCLGSDMIYGFYPAMVCEDCSLAINEVLSKETRDRWNRFIADNFPGPPSVDEPMPVQPVLI